jgi:hypothetical protein
VVKIAAVPGPTATSIGAKNIGINPGTDNAAVGLLAFLVLVKKQVFWLYPIEPEFTCVTTAGLRGPPCRLDASEATADLCIDEMMRKS